MWLFQQYGNLILAFAFVMVAAIVLRSRSLAIAGVAAFALKLSLERVVKHFVERQRPGTSIGDVTLRGSNVSAHGLSFVSGHAVISAAVATILTPLLSRRWRWVIWTFVGLNGVARIYVGAHNPLDVIGGLGLGVFIGGMLNAGLAPQSHSPTPPDQPLPVDEPVVAEDLPQPVTSALV
jgi:membrane-associated phospholipid phosphatase